MSQMGYREGTITLTNGSAVVTGTLTGWGNPAFVRVGDGLYIKGEDELWHLVDEIAVARGNPEALNTELELAGAWEGSTLEDIPYLIMPVALIRSSTAALAYDISTFTQNITVFVSGEGPPDPEYGANGWGYFDSINNKFHIKSGGEWNAGVSIIGPPGPAGPSYQSTSTSSNVVETGNKTFTVQASRGYTAGQRVRATFDASNYVEGPVSSYSGTTLIIAVERAVGSGTRTSWNINIIGDVGPAMNLTAGTITTGDAGTDASASITGDLPNRVLNLTIPRGAQGIQGEEGPQGEPGAAATISVGNVTTVSHEEPATVTNSGTSSEAVFDFEIPQGEPGISITPRGEYGDSTEYSFNDAVLDNGSTWVYINDTPSTGNALPTLPTTSNDYWQLSAQRGVDGTGAVNTVNSQSPDINGDVSLSASDIEVAHTASEYTPGGSSINDHIAAIDTRFSQSSAGAAPGETLASGSTVDLGSTTDLYISISGTTTITSFGTTPEIWRVVRFAGALTLTHNGTSLVLPGGVNITTANGDTAVFVSDGSGNWRCISYQRVSWNLTYVRAPQVYTSSTTWSNPAGCRLIRVLVKGGGGGGGGAAGGSDRAAGGGGGEGGEAEKWIDATSLTSETVTIGAGGSGGAAGANNGSAGGTSSFGSHCSADGGGGGTGSSNAAANNFLPAGAGGAALNGTLNRAGFSGGPGSRGQTVARGGWGGGQGGANGVSSDANGLAATSYGCGGSGAAANTTDRAGGDALGGIIIVEEFF